jgi:hypothetical protein
VARFVWLIFMSAVVGALLAAASFGVAYLAVGDALGAPPPDMGKRSVAFLWDGMPGRREHPRVWRFAFGPTRIPGAPDVTIYVSPTGKLIQASPSDLPERIKAFHNTGY